MTKDISENIAAEVTSRLDEIFLEEEDLPAAPKGRPPAPAVRSLMEDAVLVDAPLVVDDGAIGASGPSATVKGGGDQQTGRPARTEADPLADLNAIILSLDWEISDEIMGALSTEVKRLTAHYASDRVLSVLLQMMGAIGRYVGRNLAKSHPASLRLLQSLFESLKTIQQTPRMRPEEKKRILAIEVQTLKALKTKIARTARSVQEPPVATPVGMGAATVSQEAALHQIAGMPNALLARIMAELKSYARSEIQKLVAEEMGKFRHA